MLSISSWGMERITRVSGILIEEGHYPGWSLFVGKDWMPMYANHSMAFVHWHDIVRPSDLAIGISKEEDFGTIPQALSRSTIHTQKHHGPLPVPRRPPEKRYGV